LHHVLFDNIDFVGVESGAQLRGKLTIELDGQHVARSCCENVCDRAASRADFDDRTTGHIAQRRNNPLRGLRIVEEVLPEVGFLRHLLLRW
jgi:hypothetical protein